MPEREPMHPDLAAALRAYEVEVRDGTERSQKMAFEALRLIQRRLGGAAVLAANEIDQTRRPDTSEQQLAAG